ncbi:NnrS family protein [Saccharobesus litoralis]|uniref:NnrS family protein n=1 Tax=Saccharobesus litoralis TaxID=2172099 RepID=A0A2S0VPW3_9ALTE|nr:NnrS family protein [Saccharobesus litoralis]AWB66233.1 NnrS family protein [Saccharobesus litoralis]
MLQISEPINSQAASHKVFSSQALFELAFRPFFLLGTLSSIAALGYWILMLNGYAGFSLSGLNPVVWHLHEMLFGFGATVAVGFLLTAVQTWTGLKSIKGWALASLVGLWLAVRLFIWHNTPDSLAFALGLQTLWWLGVIAAMANLVWRSRNSRNYLFVPLLIALMLVNNAILLADIQANVPLALHLGRVCVLLFVVMMSLVGGRVIPFFTSRGAQVGSIQPIHWLEQAVVVSSLLMVVTYFASYFVASLTIFSHGLMLIAALLHMARTFNWQTAKTLFVPLLWSLHLAYLSMAIGLFLLGLSYFVEVLTLSSAMHVITIGAIGLMIFAMMARVSLGHTGRVLQVPLLVGVMFGLVFVALLARVVLPVWLDTLLAWNISVACWITASGIFLWRYMPILTRPRVR